VVEEVFVAVVLRTRDLVREEVGRIEGVFLRMARSELEDEIEQLIDRSTIDDIWRYFVRLQGGKAR
jgi:hypothetical protein